MHLSKERMLRDVLLLIVLLYVSQNAEGRYHPNIEPVNEEKLRIMILGDWGEHRLLAQDKVALGMAQVAAENKPDWVLALGDNFYPRGIFSTTDPQIENKWRNMYNNESLADLNWFITIGNHDFGENNINEWNQVELSKIEPRWHMPHLWYDFVIERPNFSAHFIILDTESFREEINNHTEIIPWFQQTLQQSTADWKFVAGHRDIFSAGDTGPVTSYLYNVFLPIMEANGVDAYLCGHDHNLQHMQYTKPGGPEFILSGAGGALLSLHRQENEDALKETYGVDTRYFLANYGFVTLTIEALGDEAVFEFYQHDAKRQYVYSRPKVNKLRNHRP